MIKVEASAPSNIALIKYMGKTEIPGNLSTNASLSYTLEHLRSFVTIEEAAQDAWAPLAGFYDIQLSQFGQDKFLNHFKRLKLEWKVPGNYLIRSANNFPSDCGLASSASSFAALTLAAFELAKACRVRPDETLASLSRHSRKGSGSSCRSFFTPWAVWRGDGAELAPLDVRLEHAVLIAADTKKTVSSSEAHKRVPTSLLFHGRTERAEERLRSLIVALKAGDWKESFELCWSEFWDMHALFESSQPSFGYMNDETMKILNYLRAVWIADGDGPLVTMDAGANVHILLRPDQVSRADKWVSGFQHQKSWTNLT